MKNHLIYALVDPDNLHVRYVGRTSQTAASRLRHHLSAAKRGHTAALYAWIRSISPRVPLLIVLQELENYRVRLGEGRYESSVAACETKWMKRFERSRLFNRIQRGSHVYKRLVNS
ncbi:MAG TPA: GIY-YIG nuclease family protein [Terriglobales bacterium]|nr:GIY-YIG nuclease family protein [Terriglobales bacterium]